MATLVTDPGVEEILLAKRREFGGDRYDEVWEGIYIMSPMPNVDHQEFVGQFTGILQVVVQWRGLGKVCPGVNVSDREDDWTENYRIPDVAVFLNDTTARNCGEFWLGGPDLAIEITSPHDKTYEKLPFYEKVNVRELLIVNRQLRQLELYRLDSGDLTQKAIGNLENGAALPCETVGLTFRVIEGEERPQVEVRETNGEQQMWRV